VSPYAGHLKLFLTQWQAITDDESVINTIAGYRIPFNTEPKQFCDPNQTMFSDIENREIDNCIIRLQSIGAIKEAKPSCPQFVSKIFAVPKSDGSYRLILNLKQLNTFIESEHFKMEDYRTVCNMLEDGMFLASIDLKDAYHLIPVHLDHQVYLRFVWRGKLYQYTCLPFGLTTAPRVFTKIMRPVVAYLRKQGNLSVQYLDDLLLLARSLNACEMNIKITSEFLTWLGFLINESKSVLYPQNSIQYLGFIFDSNTMTISLPESKRSKLTKLCENILRNPLCKIKQVAELVGHLIAACPAVAYGILYTRQLEYEKAMFLLANNNDYMAFMSLSDKAKEDIASWLHHLMIAKNRIRRDYYDYTLETDASLTGWGVRYGDSRAHGHWTNEQQVFHINKLELIAIEYGLKTFFKEFRNKSILVRTDNTTAIAYINRFGGCKSPDLHEVAKTIWTWCEAKDIWLTASYISSSQNYLADFESRKARREADSEWTLNTKYFDIVTKELGMPDIDLFAFHLNTKCEIFASWHPDPRSKYVDAFTISWSNMFFFAFPPICLLPRVLRKIRQDKARGIVVAPVWNSQPWYPVFMSMTDSTTVYLGPHTDMMFCPLTNRIHPLNRTLELMVAILC